MSEGTLDICARCYGIIGGEVPWPKARCTCPPDKQKVGHTIPTAEAPRWYVESLRVNMGLLAENAALKKKAREG